LKTVKINPRTTASQIAKDIKEKYNKHLHNDTVCKILKKEYYNSRTARKKPPRENSITSPGVLEKSDF